MSIYLAHNHKMLKADSARPGRYFARVLQPIDLDGLAYLTYFDRSEYNAGFGQVDKPAFRSGNFPIIQGASDGYNVRDRVFTSASDGLPSDFKNSTYLEASTYCYSTDSPDVHPVRTVGLNLPWAFPYSGSETFTVTYRARIQTNRIMSGFGGSDQHGTGTRHPMQYNRTRIGLTAENDGFFGIGDYDSSNYPSKVIIPESDTLYNGAQVQNYDTWLESLDFSEPTVTGLTSIPGDQWYQVALVCRGDNTVYIYLNGTLFGKKEFTDFSKFSIVDLPFYAEYTSDDYYYVRYINPSDGKESYPVHNITELAVWTKDLSYDNGQKVKTWKSPLMVVDKFQTLDAPVYVPNTELIVGTRFSLPENSILLKYKPGTSPSVYNWSPKEIQFDSSLYNADENLWLVQATFKYASGHDWSETFKNDTNLLRIVDCNFDFEDVGLGAGLVRTFEGCTSLTSVDVMMNVQNATHLSYLFKNCTALTRVPYMRTWNCRYFTQMFYGCTSLEHAPEFELYYSRNNTMGIDMSEMFSGCTSLKTVPFYSTLNRVLYGRTSYDPPVNMRSMFYNCVNVESGALALYNYVHEWNGYTEPGTNHYFTFQNCGSNTVTGAEELAQIPSSWK